MINLKVGQVAVLNSPCNTFFCCSDCKVIAFSIEQDFLKNFCVIAVYYDIIAKSKLYNIESKFKTLKKANNYLKPILELYGLKEVKEGEKEGE